jgi:large subunit ribosomal protein L29
MFKPETLNDSSKLRDHSVAELQAANLQLKEAQMKLRLQHAIGQVEKTHQIRELRRQRARLLTVMSEKLAAHDLGAHKHAAADATVPAPAAKEKAAKPAKGKGMRKGAKLAKKGGHTPAPHKAKAKAAKAKAAKPAAKKGAAKKKTAKKK